MAGHVVARSGGCLPPSSRLPLLLLLLLLAGQLAAGARQAHRRAAGRRLKLVGGRAARDGSRYAYLARIHFLLDDDRGLLAGCGGTLVSPRVVLTAAHCTALAKEGGKNVYVRIGAFNPLTDEAFREGDYELRRVDKVVPHPDYVQGAEDQPTSPHDLALLQLDKPLPRRFPTIQLPAADTPYPGPAAELHALGWGSLDSENSQPAYALQDLTLPAVSRELCAKQWSYAGAPAGLVIGGHICAGLESQRNICFGDSGGPLLVKGASTRADVQLGVVSFSFPTCALPGMPGVFTFLPMYRAWLDAQLAALDSDWGKDGGTVGQRSVAPVPSTPAPAGANSTADGSAGAEDEETFFYYTSTTHTSSTEAEEGGEGAPAPMIDGAAQEQEVEEPSGTVHTATMSDLMKPMPPLAAAEQAAPAPAPAAAQQPLNATSGEEQQGAAEAPAAAAATADEQLMADAASALEQLSAFAWAPVATSAMEEAVQQAGRDAPAQAPN